MKNFIAICVELVTFSPTILYYLPYSMFWAIFLAPMDIWDAGKDYSPLARVAYLAGWWPLAIVLAPVGVPIMLDLARHDEARKAERRALREAQAQA